MATELEKARITEIQVRMDCNGCVQKIKKALHGINGIYEVYIDFGEQKITVVGRAELEKIVKAIKKTRKSAVICSHTEQQPGADPPESSSPPAAEAAQPTEETTTAAEEKQSPETTETDDDQTSKPSKDNKVEEAHVIYHYPNPPLPDYGPSNISHGYGTPQWNSQPSGQGLPQAAQPPLPSDPRFRHEAPPLYSGYPPIYVSHSYNSYKPSPHVTRYECVQSSSSSPPTTYPLYYGTTTMTEEYYHYTDDDDYHSGNIDQVFSEENPNSCTIV